MAFSNVKSLMTENKEISSAKKLDLRCNAFFQIIDLNLKYTRGPNKGPCSTPGCINPIR